MDYLLTNKSRFSSAPPSGQFKMDINGHEKSPQNGQVEEEKTS